VPTIPADAKKPADHLEAVRAEAEGDGLATIEFNGITFSFPADPLDWTNDAMLAFEESKAVTALRAVLGADAYAKHRLGSWTMRATTGLFEAIAEKAGFARSGN